jgi:hypothetical protein
MPFENNSIDSSEFQLRPEVSTAGPLSPNPVNGDFPQTANLDVREIGFPPEDRSSG